MLTSGPATEELLTVVYECLAAQLYAGSELLPQAAIGTSTRVASATFEKHWDEIVKPLVAQLRALCKILESVDARLTVVTTRWNGSRSGPVRLRKDFMKTHVPARRPFSTSYLDRRRPLVHHLSLPLTRRSPARFRN